jgi:hypothetical protein
VLLSYVHNNPVRAGVVEDPSDSSWTSHRAYLGEAAAPRWLDIRLGLHLCGFEFSPSGRDAFHKLAVARAGECRSIELSGGDLNARRRQTRLAHNGPVEIQCPQLGERTGQLEVTTSVFVPPSCKVRLPWQGESKSVLLVVERLTGVSPFELCSRNRSRRVVGARRLAMTTWSLYLNRPSVEIARALGVTSSSAAELIASADAGTHERAAAAAAALDAPNVGASVGFL